MMESLRQADVVGVGLNATDTLIRMPQHPERGSKIVFESAETLPGGQVASAIIACARWGLRTRYIGKIGDDAAADIHRAEFARAGVETQLVTAANCPSQQAFIFIDPSGERTVLWKRDRRLTLQVEELNRDFIAGARALHIDGHDTAAAVKAAEWARAAGAPVVADLDDLYAGIEWLLPNIDYLIVSRDIPARLTGISNLQRSLPVVQERYGSRLVAATLGEQGVLAWDGARFHHSAAYRVNVVDTTGAGDIFHAGFLYGLLQGWPLQRELEFACAAAALNCTGVGARGRIRSISEIESLMATGSRHPAPRV